MATSARMTRTQAGEGRPAALRTRAGEGGDDATVAILAPVGRDGAVASAVLARAGLAPRVCDDVAVLCSSLEETGVLLVAEEALHGPARQALLEALGAQPSWSDVPIVLLTGEGELSRALSPTLQAVAASANVTLLERPVRVATLVTALRSALRARRRQFDVRDHLDERTVAEVALRSAREQAEEANRAKGDFLAVMSHELRTPLNAIGGYAELLQLGIHGPVTTEQTNALGRIRRSQRHLLTLINDLLNFAKLEAGQVEYHVTDVRVVEAFDALEALVAPQLAAKALRFSREECGLECVVRADRDKLQQVLVNLLSNAIKFTPEGGSVELHCDRDGGVVRLAVRDSGIGIAEDRLEQVFAPFVQLDRRLNSPNEGVGLGLAISRDLARGMGGELSAESTIGEGSTFTLALPAA